MNPYDHLESEQTRIDERRHFIIDNKKCLFDHGDLRPMKAIKGKYIPVIASNKTKEIFIKNCKDKSLFGLDSSEEIPNFTNNEISESNIKCEICTIQLWNVMFKNTVIEINTYSSESPKKN